MSLIMLYMTCLTFLMAFSFRPPICGDAGGLGWHYISQLLHCAFKVCTAATYSTLGNSLKLVNLWNELMKLSVCNPSANCKWVTRVFKCLNKQLDLFNLNRLCFMHMGSKRSTLVLENGETKVSALSIGKLFIIDRMFFTFRSYSLISIFIASLPYL